MAMTNPDVQLPHSAAWTVQAWISFTISFGVILVGIYWLPVEIWIKAFLAMGVLFVVGSSLSLAKTLRDLHEAQKLTRRIDDARVTKLIAEHDPLKPAL